MTVLRKCFAVSCFASTLLIASCSSTQQVAYTKAKPHNNTVKSQNPRFLDNVTVGGSANSSNVKLKIPAAEHINKDLADFPTEPCPIPMPETKLAPIAYKNSSLTEDNFLSSKYAMVLGILPTAISNYSLYHFIEEWYGTRYRMGGKDKSGIDCSAFVQKLYEEVFGTPVVRTAFEQFNACQRVYDHSDLKEGDLVFFRIRSKRISHVGVYLANDYFVHASSTRGVMISNLNEGYWSRFYAGGGKM